MAKKTKKIKLTKVDSVKSVNEEDNIVIVVKDEKNLINSIDRKHIIKKSGLEFKDKIISILPNFKFLKPEMFLKMRTKEDKKRRLMLLLSILNAKDSRVINKRINDLSELNEILSDFWHLEKNVRINKPTNEFLSNHKNKIDTTNLVKEMESAKKEEIAREKLRVKLNDYNIKSKEIKRKVTELPKEIKNIKKNSEGKISKLKEEIARINNEIKTIADETTNQIEEKYKESKELEQDYNSLVIQYKSTREELEKHMEYDMQKISKKLENANNHNEKVKLVEKYLKDEERLKVMYEKLNDKIKKYNAIKNRLQNYIHTKSLIPNHINFDENDIYCIKEGVALDYDKENVNEFENLLNVLNLSAMGDLPIIIEQANLSKFLNLLKEFSKSRNINIFIEQKK